MSLMALAERERTTFADFLTTLSPEQWDAPSLCAGWRVRDVVAHMISYDELDMSALARRLVRAAMWMDRANAIGVADYAGRSPEELVALIRKYARPRGLPAGFGGMIALVDCTIHHQDIRRPLGLAREIPPDQLRQVLRCALLAPPTGAAWRTRRLKLRATDVDFSAGYGALVSGPAEPLLMAMAGRRGAVAALSGPGQRTLAARIGG